MIIQPRLTNLVVHGDLDLPLLDSLYDKLLHLLERKPHARQVRLQRATTNNKHKTSARRRTIGKKTEHHQQRDCQQRDCHREKRVELERNHALDYVDFRRDFVMPQLSTCQGLMPVQTSESRTIARTTDSTIKDKRTAPPRALQFRI